MTLALILTRILTLAQAAQQQRLHLVQLLLLRGEVVVVEVDLATEQQSASALREELAELQAELSSTIAMLLLLWLYLLGGARAPSLE